MDVFERLFPEGMIQSSVVLASLVYHAAGVMKNFLAFGLYSGNMTVYKLCRASFTFNGVIGVE